MKTINYEDKVLRILLVLSLSFVSILLISEFNKGEIKEEGKIASFLAIASAIAGMLLGYLLALKIIRMRIVNCFDNAIKFSTKDHTVVSGKLTVITKGLKIEHILLEDETFKVEGGREKNIHKEIAQRDFKCTLIIGRDLPKSTMTEQAK